MKMRTHVVLPEELVRAIDAMVGRGKRSRFIEEAVRERLRREAAVCALEETAGVLSVEAHPEWVTREGVAAWVRESRKLDDTRLERLRRE